MNAELSIGEVTVDVLFKDIKNLHLSVYPPTGRVRISAPHWMSLDNIRLFAVSKISWIKNNQGKIASQPRETPREYLERESHYVWGRRYLLNINEGGVRPIVALGHHALELTVPENAPTSLREEVLMEWYRSELREEARPILDKWAKRLNVDLDGFTIQRMKTKWGSSNPARRTIRLNLELARLDLRCLDYVILHELAHFIAPTHGPQFIDLLDRNMPEWRSVRDKLNEGPLPALESRA
jgi:predicted metal-dependent hydrolase